MKKFLIVLLTFALILIGTYCQAEEKKLEEESKITTEEKKAEAPAEE
jgi:hypothetical protein